MEVEPSFDPGPSNAEDLNRGKYFFFFTILIMLQLIVFTGGVVLEYEKRLPPTLMPSNSCLI